MSSLNSIGTKISIPIHSICSGVNSGGGGVNTPLGLIVTEDDSEVSASCE